MTSESVSAGTGSSLLPGRPDDYLGTFVADDGLLAAIEQRAAIDALLSDGVPLPRTEARDGHSDDRHLEYWLSGWWDGQTVMRVLGLAAGRKVSVLGLEYAGCGRVSRHVARDDPNVELFCGVSDPVQVRVLNAVLGRVRAFQGPSFPHLPFPDASIDGAFAFSVLPSTLDACAWLLEFRRVLKPGAILYATVEDPETWAILARSSDSGGPSHTEAPTDSRNAHVTETGGQPNGRHAVKPAPPPILPPLTSPLLELWGKVFHVDAAEARSKRDEVAVVLCA